MVGMDQKDTRAVCWFTGDDASCAVFLPWLSGPDARHHGRYEPGGLLQGVFSSIGGRPGFFGITAGMD